MPMPTTRYGRYLYYRNRQMKRRRRVERRRRKTRTFPGWVDTARRRDYVAWSKQVEKSYPRYVGVRLPFPFYYTSRDWEPPTWGRFAVIHRPVGIVFFEATRYHLRGALSGYHARRVKSMPRVKYLGVMPYAGGAITAENWGYYPFEFYPSGRPNPNWHWHHP